MLSTEDRAVIAAHAAHADHEAGKAHAAAVQLFGDRDKAIRTLRADGMTDQEITDLTGLTPHAVAFSARQDALTAYAEEGAANPITR